MAVIITHVLLCSAREYVYIKSTSTDAEECSTEQHSCFTLAYYAQNADIYFRSDTTVVLLGGIHAFNINSTIVVKDIKNLVMQGSSVNSKPSTVVVQCIGNGGFEFINITSFQINGRQSMLLWTCATHFCKTTYLGSSHNRRMGSGNQCCTAIHYHTLACSVWCVCSKQHRLWNTGNKHLW